MESSIDLDRSFMSIKAKVRKLLNMADINRPVFFALSAKVWSMSAGLVTAILIATKFTPELQGFYYTFAGVLAFQFLVELGLGNVILQFASHEWSKLTLNNMGQILGDNEALSRLQSLAKFAFRWYSIASLFLTVGLIIGGYYFFSKKAETISWTMPWLFLCILNGILFCVVPIWSLLEGCNQISTLYAYRLIQGIFSNLAMWVAVLFGAELWAPSVSSLVTIACALGFLGHNYRSFLKTLLFSAVSGPYINWRREIWPLQWRTMITWLIGSLSFTLFTPVLFHYHGPVIAGQMGMTWNVIGVVSAISGSWLVPKIPQFGIFIAQKRYAELDSLFWKITKIVVGITTGTALIIYLAVATLNWLNHPLAARLLPLQPSGIFLLAQVLLIVSYPFSVYLRAHKREPLLILSVLQGIMVALSTLILGKHYSATGIAAGYLVINITLTPFTVLIWNRCRKEWHNNEIP